MHDAYIYDLDDLDAYVSDAHIFDVCRYDACVYDAYISMILEPDYDRYIYDS